MATATPRRSLRIHQSITPKMSERKKGLFQSDEDSRSSMTQHRLPAVESDSDTDDCDLGIISTLDSSSSDEYDQNVPRTPEKIIWHETRSHTKLLKQSHLKNFMKSPFTLNKFQTKYTSVDSVSTPVTPHVHHQPETPSSTHSCASAHTTSSERSRARKSLASLIADTESCSSSLKDLNFDTDSDTDTKENTPKQNVRKSTRMKKMTPKFASFKGILMEQRKNHSSPTKPVSPSQIYRTPENTPDVAVSPPKINHNRRSVVEIAESPEPIGNNDKCYKRLRNETMSDSGPNPKHLKLDTICTAPKARLSLFANDLREISTKSFYGKTDFDSSLTTKLSTAIAVSATERKFGNSHSYKSRNKRMGQINMGVRHRIKKPKIHNRNRIINLNVSPSLKAVLGKCASNLNNTSIGSQNSSQADLDNEKADPFDKEKRTIDTLLSQWTEEEVPESELTRRTELDCFNKTVMEDSPIFNPVTPIPVDCNDIRPESQQILELGSKGSVKKPDQTTHDDLASDCQDIVMVDGAHKSEHCTPKANFLPVDCGYIVVDENYDQEDLPDLDEIDRELKMLDEQILKMVQSNNMNAHAVIASTETISTDVESSSSSIADNDAPKLFPIFDKATLASVSTSPKKNKVLPMRPARTTILKSGSQQYVIDAGQKKFGATQCKECDVIYQIGDPKDEYDHLVYHHAFDVLKFNGFKEETVCGAWEHGRCISVRGGKGPLWRRVQALLARVVHPYLGYPEELPRDDHTYTAFLYVEKKRILGCAVLEPKARAHRLIPGDPDCCSAEDYPVKCGVSRIWTHKSHTRRGIARRMLDCARAFFLYGQAIPVAEIAFSAPTEAGKQFATKYTGTKNFFIYLD